MFSDTMHVTTSESQIQDRSANQSVFARCCAKSLDNVPYKVKKKNYI